MVSTSATCYGCAEVEPSRDRWWLRDQLAGRRRAFVLARTAGRSTCARDRLPSRLSTAVHQLRSGELRNIMTRVERLQQQIGELDPDEFAQLREWFMEQEEKIQREAEFSRAVDRVIRKNAELYRRLS